MNQMVSSNHDEEDEAEGRQIHRRLQAIPSYCRTYDEHCQRVNSEVHGLGGANKAEELLRSQADRERLYDKLSLAEQVLEQITEELSVLSAENKFLAKLNQRLTYHACRQEKYFIDFRK